MGLRDLKIPKMKFKKMKMDVEELEKVDYEKLEKKPIKKRTEPYENRTHYETVKEFFTRAVKKYPNEPCILEKPDHKTPYKEITFNKFLNAYKNSYLSRKIIDIEMTPSKCWCGLP